jgi:hypothetical protein
VRGRLDGRTRVNPRLKLRYLEGCVMARQAAAKDQVLKGAKRPLRSGGQGADTAGPGAKGAPTPVVAYGCGTWQPR